ncbi:hypothetical protein DL769_002839 [Monosporascus sp. CRB-8-3]|nr:hypothetical protein DL769_002839 [Monosporascus sp. CRB-8-3]
MSAGPLVVPVRLYLDPKQTVADFLRDVQAHAPGIVPLLVVRTANPIIAPPAAITGYSLVVHALLHDNDVVELSATYDSGLLADAQVTTLSHYSDRVVQQLLSPGETGTLLRDVSLAGEWDL